MDGRCAHKRPILKQNKNKSIKKFNISFSQCTCKRLLAKLAFKVVWMIAHATGVYALAKDRLFTLGTKQTQHLKKQFVIRNIQSSKTNPRTIMENKKQTTSSPCNNAARSKCLPRARKMLPPASFCTPHSKNALDDNRHPKH